MLVVWVICHGFVKINLLYQLRPADHLTCWLIIFWKKMLEQVYVTIICTSESRFFNIHISQFNWPWMWLPTMWKQINLCRNFLCGLFSLYTQTHTFHKQIGKLFFSNSFWGIAIHIKYRNRAQPGLNLKWCYLFSLPGSAFGAMVLLILVQLLSERVGCVVVATKYK